MPNDFPISPSEPAPNLVMPIGDVLNITPSAGGSVMDGGVMQSINYVTGQSGWQISADGSTEFNDGISPDIFGNGSDGDIDINADGTFDIAIGGGAGSDLINNNVLQQDINCVNLTLSGGNLNTNGYKVFCTGKLKIDSGFQLEYNGNNGGNGGDAASGDNGDAGTGSAALPSGTLKGAPASGAGGGGAQGAESGGAGIAGGAMIASSVGLVAEGIIGIAGGAGYTQGGGVAGAKGANWVASASDIENLSQALILRDYNDDAYLRYSCSTGMGGAGGGGGGNSAYGGGGGGSGGCGGMMVISARRILNNGTISAIGGNGGDGGNGFSQGGGGGAGHAGHGGIVILIYDSLSGSGDELATAGTAGTGGAASGGGSAAGGNGTAGTDGTVYNFEV